MTRIPAHTQVHVEDRADLVQEINTLFAKGQRTAAVFHTIRLGMSDGHQNRPDADCPLTQHDLRDIWMKNRDIGRANNRKVRQPDLLTPLLGVERPQNTQTLKP